MKNILWKIKKFFYNHCRLAVLDEAAGRWIVKSESNNISYLKAENANGRHILVKPDQHIEPHYLLVDDLNIDQLNSHHKSATKLFKKARTEGAIPDTQPPSVLALQLDCLINGLYRLFFLLDDELQNFASGNEMIEAWFASVSAKKVKT
jgi:hypothetical protein